MFHTALYWRDIEYRLHLSPAEWRSSIKLTRQWITNDVIVFVFEFFLLKDLRHLVDTEQPIDDEDSSETDRSRETTSR